jgi:uncharacterized membrane protein YeaQ/YmgE (transglycosylase-associated protein family)
LLGALRRKRHDIAAWIIVGIVAGWVVDNIAERNRDLLTSLVIGVVGAFVGGFLSSGYRYEDGLNVRSILLAAVGALVLLAIFRISSNRGPDRTDTNKPLNRTPAGERIVQYP